MAVSQLGLPHDPVLEARDNLVALLVRDEELLSIGFEPGAFTAKVEVNPTFPVAIVSVGESVIDFRGIGWQRERVPIEVLFRIRSVGGIDPHVLRRAAQRVNLVTEANKRLGVTGKEVQRAKVKSSKPLYGRGEGFVEDAMSVVVEVVLYRTV